MKKGSKDYRIHGTVTQLQTKIGIKGLAVQAWDKDLLVDDYLGEAITDDNGEFEIRFSRNYFKELFMDRKPDLYFKILKNDELVANTIDSVLWNVKDQDSSVSIQLDIPIEDELPADVEKLTFSVSGIVARPNGEPLESQTVVAYDKGFGTLLMLDDTLTDGEGRYRIEYQTKDLINPQKQSADLIVRIIDEHAPEPILASSPLILNALQQETINLIVGEEAYVGRSEYQSLQAQLTPYLEQLPLGEITDLDIAHLSNITHRNSQTVQQYINALEKSAELAGNINPELLYGLFRRGQPSDLNKLSLQSSDQLIDSINSAVDSNLIQDQSGDSIDSVVNALNQYSVDRIVNQDLPEFEEAHRLLNLTELSVAKKETFLNTYLQVENTEQNFWQVLQQNSDLDDTEIQKSRLVFELSAISINHSPLVEKILLQDNVTELKDLGGRIFEDWVSFLQSEAISIPDTIPGDSEQQKRSNYAMLLARVMEDRFPTRYFASSWIRSENLDSDIRQFFIDNPDFAFENDNINQYFQNQPHAMSRTDAIDQELSTQNKLKNLQNLFRIAPSFERFRAITPLWQDNIHSSHTIKKMGKEKFVMQYADTMGGANYAAKVYANAEKTANVALMTLVKYAWDTNNPAPYVVPGTDLSVANNQDAQATLESLFGSLDFCNCKHCRSVLSPAAYLVDLLAFLNGATDNSGQTTALEELFERRPDIGNIELSCDNTNTPLPYIDLVNEVLEDVLVPRTYTPATYGVTTVYNAEVPQTDEEANVLQSSPEHTNVAAYDILKAAKFPWFLPFNLWAQEARDYLTQLGVKRYELMQVFNGSGASSPSKLDIATEILTMTPAERGYLTSPETDTNDLRALWGLTGSETLGSLKNVATFLQQSGLEYDELTELLQCQFINPQGVASPIQIQFESASSCDTTKAELTHFADAQLNSKADRLHRFSRLRRKLGWSFFELDRVLLGLGKADIDNDTIEQLADIVLLKNKLKNELSTFVAWYADHIDSAAYRDSKSLYEQLFLNTSVGEVKASVIATLTLNASGTELSATDKTFADSDYRTLVLGAVNISSQELDLIITQDLSGDDTLNLANLSQVYRIASLSNSLKLSVAEYYTAQTLSGLAPISTLASTAKPEDTLQFIKALDLIAQSNIKLPQLAYLLQHDDTQLGIKQLLPSVISQKLKKIQTDLNSIISDSAGLEANETNLRSKLSSWLTDETNLDIGVAIVLGTSSLSNSDQKTFIADYFSEFLDVADAQDQLVPPVNGLGTDQTARIHYLFENLLQFALDQSLNLHFSDQLNLSIEGSKALLNTLEDPTDNTVSFRELLNDEAFLSYTNTFHEALFPKLFTLYERADKAANILNALKLDTDEQAFAIDEGSNVGWLNFNDLPLTLLTNPVTLAALFNQLTRMVESFAIRNRQFKGDTTLVEYMESIQDLSTIGNIQQALADATTWELSDIQTLTTNFGFNLADLQSSQALIDLDKAFSFIKRISVSAAQTWSWNTADPTFDEASQIRFAVKSKYSNAQWLKIAPDLRDPIRERQRDALLAHVIHDKDFKDANEVYSYFLIDPEMSACMDTSRIKQAVSSTQLFVQRMLMNLEETDVAFTYADAKQWQWRKNYRVWEANRKVFLYPENWIYPELRDDKTQFFKDLEDELSQGDLNKITAEKAYLHYLKKLDTVAHLEVKGVYEEIDPALEKNNLHVIARTKAQPYLYFYRRREKGSYWTPWEPVDVEIEGDHIVPVIHNRRLFLFWAKFTEKAVEPSTSSMAIDTEDEEVKPTAPSKYYEVQLAWSKLNSMGTEGPTTTSGEWSEARIASFRGNTLDFDNLKNEFYFFAEHISNGDLIIRAGLIPLEFNNLVFTLFKYNDVKDDVEQFKLPSDGSVSSLVFYQNLLLNKLPEGDNQFNDFVKTKDKNTFSLWSFAQIDSAGIGQINDSTDKIETLLKDAGDQFNVTLPHQYPTFTSQGPLFYRDNKRTFFVAPKDLYGTVYFPWADAFKADAYSVNPVDLGYLERGYVEQQENPVWEEINPSGPIEEEPYVDIEDTFFVGMEFSDMVVDRTAGTNVPAMATQFAGNEFMNNPAMENRGSTVGAAYNLRGLEASGGAYFAETSVANAQHYFADITVATDQSDLYGALTGWSKKVWLGKQYQFQTYYHPYVPLMIKQLNRYGIDGLLAPNSDHGNDWEDLKHQQVYLDYFDSEYDPTSWVNSDYPLEDFDFQFTGAYSQYNWELFFHGPLLIAERLSQNKRFEEAQKWFHYIFDPTETEGNAPERFWKIKPFFNYKDETSIAVLLQKLSEGDDELEAQIEAWADDPFNPHLIARMRIVAYMKTTVMKYIDNLIAWGDHLFTRDTIESINEATQIYVLASQILGRKPVQVEKNDVSSATFNELLPQLDSFSNALVEVESQLPWLAPSKKSTSSGESSVLDSILYFCVPHNELLAKYWTTVEDRLFKIRHCMNIKGIKRSLALFEPPIDPAALVKARAAGLDLSSVLNSLNAPLPHYRFRHVIQQALDFCSDVRALGNQLLQALEKKDQEELALLRASNQVDLLKSMRDVKDKAITEAEYNKSSLEYRLEQAEIRYDHYRNLETISPNEDAALHLQTAALVPQANVVVNELLTAAMSLIPNFNIGASGFGGSPHVTATFGSTNIMGSLSHINSFLLQSSALLNSTASMINTIASYERRQEDWDLQTELADTEIDELKEQLELADVRIDIAKRNLTTHDLQIDQAEEEEEFLESKYTNKNLYNWMVTQISTLYFQSYQIAYDLAKRAEQCYQYELGVNSSNYIQFGYWDSLKKGLLSGERLQKDLRRLQSAYMDNNEREHELTKSVSLAQLNPIQLHMLRETGSCEFTIPEVLFDLDYPGHYMRRIKHVSLTIPCIIGPYSNVNAKLTLKNNRIRTSTDTAGGYTYTGVNDARFKHGAVGITALATSNGQNDTGLFQLNYQDERYLPVEGAGAVSTWTLELPETYRQFDYRTITDAILTLEYTSRDGGDVFQTAVDAQVTSSLNKLTDILSASDTGITRVISTAREASNLWHRFMYPAAAANEQSLSFELSKQYMPYLFKDKTLSIAEITVVLLLEDADDYTGGSLSITVDGPSASTITANMTAGDADQPSLDTGFTFDLEDDSETIEVTISESDIAGLPAALRETRDTKERLNPEKVLDLLLVVNYTVGS